MPISAPDTRGEQSMGRMTASEIDALLRSAEVAVLCTVGANGEPEGTPVWFDYDGRTIRILVHKDSRKARNIGLNPNVSVTVDTRIAPYRGVVLVGRASLGGPEPALRRSLAERYLGAEVAVRYLANTIALDQQDALVTVTVRRRFSWDYSKGYAT